MKKFICIVIYGFLLAACNNGKDGIPEVSDIRAEVIVERFDRDFFEIDSNNVGEGLDRVMGKYPVLTPIFLQNILGLDSAVMLEGVRSFLRLSRPVYERSEEVFSSNRLKDEFENAFRYVKYYFPRYEVPEIVTILGPPDALAQTSTGYTPNFLGPGFLGISLQFYLGRDFALYQDPYFIENIAPAYRSRRFSREYIIADAMMLVADDLFPDRSKGKPLLEQMVERGKQWWLLDKFLPAVPDSVKTGFTQAQLEWCESNEGLIWSYITRNENLNAVDLPTIQTYIGEGPFTQGFSQEQSPGNLGQWIGWQIVGKFAENNSGADPSEVMNTPARIIIEEAKYKPK